MIKNAVGMAIMAGLLFASVKVVLWALTITIVLTVAVKCLTAAPNLGNTRGGGGGRAN